ncbi:hypothetical protein ACH4KO_32360 [Streptomyces anulatus]
MPRVELTLALGDHKPLASLGLSPDPLQQLAAAMASVRAEDGEQAAVVLDLVPVRERRLARRRRQLLARSRRRGPSAYGERLTHGPGGGGGGGWEAVGAAWSGGKSATGGRGDRLPRMTDLRDGVGKFDPAAGAVFAVQLLLRTEARHPQTALARMNQLIAAFSTTSGENYLKARRPRTRWHIGHFDRRFDTGEFAPRRRQWLTVPEIAGFLKPPTLRCRAASVVRSGGLVPPAPSDLPVYTGQKDLVPLGAVTYADGRERIGAARVKDLLFALGLGKSGHGKTEAALVQCIAMAHSGYGTWFLDPHGEGWARAKPYLAHPHIAPRVWEIDLAHAEPDQLVASCNLLSMEGRPLSAAKDIVRAVTEGIAAAQDWGDNAPPGPPPSSPVPLRPPRLLPAHPRPLPRRALPPGHPARRTQHLLGLGGRAHRPGQQQQGVPRRDHRAAAQVRGAVHRHDPDGAAPVRDDPPGAPAEPVPAVHLRS